MSFTDIKEKLQTLRLHGMSQMAERLLNTPAASSLSNEEFLEAVVDAEVEEVTNRRKVHWLKQAKLKYSQACLETIDYSVDRGLDRQIMLSLTNCNWVAKSQVVAITGPTGCGKTEISCALARQSISLGYRAIFYRMTRLLEEMELQRGLGTLLNFREKIQKFDVLVIDDWAVSPLTARGRLDLLDLIEDRTDKSIIISSQLPVENWYEYLGDASIADAILDRIIHRAHRIKLHGESMRKLSDKI